MSARVFDARAVCAAGAAAVAVLLAGCSGSSSHHAAAQSPSSQPSSSSVAPSTSAPATSSSAPAPLSAFENYAGVKAIRAWTAQAARTVNSGHDDDAALNALMTASFTKGMQTVLGREVGYYFPGPIPFQPLKVTTTDATHQVVNGCLWDAGYAIDKKTHTSVKKVIVPAAFYTVEQGGRWLVDDLSSSKSVSCTGVTVQAPKW